MAKRLNTTNPYERWPWRLAAGFFIGGMATLCWGTLVITTLVGIAAGTLFPATVLPWVAGKTFYYLLWGAMGSVGGVAGGPMSAALLCHAPTRGRVFLRSLAGSLAGLISGNLVGMVAYSLLVQAVDFHWYTGCLPAAFYGFQAGLFAGAMVSVLWHGLGESAGHADDEDC